jgi:two-component system LytT family sensor kinase
MMKRTLTRIGLHTAFWISIWFLFYYFFNYNSSDRTYVLWFSSLLLPLTMGLTYFAVYFLIPRFLYPGKYGRFALYTFYTLLVSSYFIVLMIYGLMFLYKDFHAALIPPMVKNFFFILLLVYLVVGLVSFTRILNRNTKTERQNRELQHKMLSTQLQLKEQELHYLKKQIHPHFLFNTLNTIYGLSIKNSTHTPDTILKLSNLLDYILYQVDKPRVPLAEEIDHIREYLELEKIRFQEGLKLEMDADPVEKDIQIAPMLLIPLVENAFKHGGRRDGSLKIHIEIKARDHQLEFRIRNTVTTNPADQTEGGLGLENVQKRLELHYPGIHTLSNELKDHWYTAQLIIQDLSRLYEPEEHQLYHRG